ncbi:10418_t:CDS:2 [Ambispora leptoticha]|uniref:10418_t:CDS:1 n=1 Tax=Ambispora leptoticha TaxID=144679 RepID=A0A9N9EKC8_9GLOM|nr:10418_t:CDS:2 [Ambispora leptoticha]
MSFTWQTRPARTQTTNNQRQGGLEQQQGRLTNTSNRNNSGKTTTKTKTTTHTRNDGGSHSQLQQEICGDGGQRLGGGSLMQEATDVGVNPVLLAAVRRMQQTQNIESGKDRRDEEGKNVEKDDGK